MEKEVPKTQKTKERDDILDRDILMEEVVDAAFALKSNKAAGSDSILNNDIIELLDTSKPRENWKNVEILKFVHKMISNFGKRKKSQRSLRKLYLDLL